MSIGPLVGLAGGAAEGVGEGVAKAVEVDELVAVPLAVRVKEGSTVAVGDGVREGVKVTVAVASARSTSAKSPKVEMYAHWVPCSGSNESNTWTGSCVQVEPLRCRITRR